MQRSHAKPPRSLVWLEQAAVLATSLVWTAVVLLIISFVWVYQDAQARWEAANGQSAPLPAAWDSSDVSLPPTLWAELPDEADTPTPPVPPPTATATAAPTPWPTPTATYVLGPAGLPPDTLPETPLEGQPTPTPTTGRQPPPAPPHTPIPTPTPTATATPLPPAAANGPTRLVIKSVGIDTPVVPVSWSVVEQNGQQFSVWQVADYAAGWHMTSAPPGQPGNTVLSGHHNIKGEIFRYLVDVQEGDEVDVYVGDMVYQYYVEQKLILKEKGEPAEVRRQNAQWIAPTDDVRLTLVTCWPYTNNTHRVIVVAKPR